MYIYIYRHGAWQGGSTIKDGTGIEEGCVAGRAGRYIIHAHTFTHTHSHTHTHTHTYTHIHTYIHTYTFIHIHSCIFIYTYPQGSNRLVYAHTNIFT